VYTVQELLKTLFHGHRAPGIFKAAAAVYCRRSAQILYFRFTDLKFYFNVKGEVWR